MKMKKLFVLNIGLILLLLTACRGLNAKPVQPVLTPTLVVSPTSGLQYQFVTNKLLLPSTKEQTQAYALNIDNDLQQTTDNKFGDFLTLLTSAAQGLELQATLDQAIDAGQLVTLHMVKTDDLMNDPSVSWSIYLGQQSQTPLKFDGSDEFTLDSSTPLNSPIIGSLKNGHFSGGPGAAQLRMYLLGQLIEVNLIGVRLEADIKAEGCVEGVLGGGMTATEFGEKLLPAIAQGLNLVIKEKNMAAPTLLQAFDADNDKLITTEELSNNPILMLAISPDIDLLDASGKFNPGQDGTNDSYSIGLGFTCVPGTFDAPVEASVP